MIDHFSHGYLTLVIAIAVSISGSALGLLLSRRARRTDEPKKRIPWLIGAAVAIGGTGIWVMHFVAMLGFDVTGATVRYDPGMTALSAVIAIVVVACGLFIVGLGRFNAAKLAIAGALTGAGVAAMHYTGMAAVVSTVELLHDRYHVAAALAIAIVASTVALWLAWKLEQAASIWLAAGVLALAVNAMHYTAMLGISAGDPTGEEAVGVTSFHLIFPMTAVTLIVMMVLIYVIVTEPPLREDEPEYYRLPEQADRVRGHRRSSKADSDSDSKSSAST